MSTPHSNKISNGARCLVFCVLIAMPLLGTFFRWDFYPYMGENRVLSPAPSTATPIAKLPEALEAYYKDHFGFRNTLIRQYQKLYGKTSSKVLFGEDDWVFLQSSVKDYLGLRPLPPAELKHIGKQYEARRAWLAEYNIPYLLIIPPDKAEIYPDKLSIDIPKEAVRTTRYDQISDYIKQHTEVDLLDLRPALKTARTERVVYLSNDTHWNPYGVHAGYTAIINELRQWMPEAEPISLADYTITSSRHHGDLSVLAGLSDAQPITIDSLIPKNLNRLSVTNYPVGPPQPWHQWPENVHPPQQMYNPNGRGRILVFHDSFGYALQHLLAQHFEETAFFWMYPSQAALENLVREFRPDLVLEIHLQRRLHITEGSPLAE